ncbi:extracellular solute-binding protein [Bordetella petrii]|uniref:extracellular solute-binding protein n=1 Tax=Bordetella petrii TaxID=94624 RepID=UPI003732E8AF
MTSIPDKQVVSRRRVLQLAGASLVMPHIWIPRADAAGRVIIRSPGGVYDDIRRETIYEPFRKETGIEVVPVATTGAKLMTMLKSGNMELDIVDITVPQLMAFQRAGALLPMPYREFKYTDPDDIDEDYKYEYIVGNFIYGVVMGYNTEAYDAGKEPQSWAEFWDARAFPGPRMLADMSVGTPDLEFALLADGVALDKLYPLDIERAFESLSRVRPAIPKFWDTGSLSAQMLSSKQAVLGSIWSPRLIAAAEAGAPVAASWNQHCVHVQAYSILKDGPNVEGAKKLVDYCLSKDVQQRYFERYKGGPVTKTAYKNLSAERRAQIPGGERTARNGFILDAQWWEDNRGKVSAAWSKWVLSR